MFNLSWLVKLFDRTETRVGKAHDRIADAAEGMAADWEELRRRFRERAGLDGAAAPSTARVNGRARKELAEKKT